VKPGDLVYDATWELSGIIVSEWGALGVVEVLYSDGKQRESHTHYLEVISEAR